MKIIRLLSVALCLALQSPVRAQTSQAQESARAQEMDKALAELAAKLAKSTQDAGRKKITVADFMDLQGSPNELGRFVAEELTVNLVMVKTNFSVLDRANLKKILAEHKLTTTGLVDPENAKKLGQFAGVDALILGTIVSRGQRISVTAKIIATDTAEIVGAGKAEFLSDESTLKLITKPTETPKSEAKDEKEKEETEDKVKMSKTFGDLRVDVKSFIVAKRDFLMTLDLVNLNPKKSLWVALNIDNGSNVKGGIMNEGGSEFVTDVRELSGIAYSAGYRGDLMHATEIPRTNSISVTLPFFSRDGKASSVGSCRFQMEFLTSYDFDGNYGTAKVNNLVTKIKAD